jgi:hypothetical protein
MQHNIIYRLWLIFTRVFFFKFLQKTPSANRMILQDAYFVSSFVSNIFNKNSLNLPSTFTSIDYASKFYRSYSFALRFLT